MIVMEKQSFEILKIDDVLCILSQMHSSENSPDVKLYYLLWSLDSDKPQTQNISTWKVASVAR